MSGQQKFTSVSIPVTLFHKIKKRIEGTGFTSVSSYVTYVLREIESESESKQAVEPFAKEDEERIREKLRALGYLD